MEFRSDADVRSSFERATGPLDAALAAATPTLLAENVSIRNFINRSGFDSSGYGHPSWRYQFECRSACVAPLCVIAVDLTYDEPIWQGESGRLRAELSIEIFHLGAPASLFRETVPLSVRLSDLAGTGLLTEIQRALDQGAEKVPAEYGSLLEQKAPAVEYQSPFGINSAC